MRFDEILRNDDVLDGLWDMHFDECTPIQEQAIPIILEGRDLLACAQTGTGKTAAYLLPVIDMLSEGGYPETQVNCVVMAPTRELAQQIDRQLQGFAYFMPVSGMAIYGGTDGHTYDQQRKSLKMGADIIIATPGRLLSHLSMGYVDLSKVSFFILDEADRMLDMRFYDDIMQIVAKLPKDRQTLLFSATMPPKIQRLANSILSDPKEIKLAVSKPAEKIKQSAYICYESQKFEILCHIFRTSPPNRVIVFSSSKEKVKTLSRELKKIGMKIAEMHSDLDQTHRDSVMNDFKSGRINLIVATDILARGIDIDDIEMVINYDAPREGEEYVHRIGRTARANREGRAITFVSKEDALKLRRIEKLLEYEIPREVLPKGIGEGPILTIEQKSRKKHRNSKVRSKGNENNKGAENKKPKTSNNIKSNTNANEKNVLKKNEGAESNSPTKENASKKKHRFHHSKRAE